MSGRQGRYKHEEPAGGTTWNADTVRVAIGAV